MDILNRIIGLMTKEELRNFRLYAKRSHDSEDRKDLKLFDYIRRSGDRFNERKIRKELYGSGRKNTYARLRNRLLSEISKSLVTLHWNSDASLEALHFLTLSILFSQKQRYEIALYFLKKAERKVKDLDNLALMDMIYGNFINLSYHLSELNPGDYIQKRNENLHTLNRFREIDNILAAVNYRIRHSQNLGQGDESILEILQETVQEFSMDPSLQDHPQFRMRMYNAVSRILLQQRDYVSLEKYLLTTYQEFISQGIFDRSNHDTLLQMLCYIINTLFKNGKISESLEYAEKLKKGMNAYGKIFHDKYLFFYYNSLATNYSVTDPHKAIGIHETILDHPQLGSVDAYQFFSRVQLAQLHFELGNYGAAAKHLAKMNLLEAFRQADAALRLKIAILEMATRLEQGEIDLLEYRSGQVRKDFREAFAAEAHQKDLAILDLIEDLRNYPKDQPGKKWKDQARQFLADYQPDETELFKYHNWVKTRL